MGVARVYSVELQGIDGQLVSVQAEVEPGLPLLYLVDECEAYLPEIRDRARAATLNSNLEWPQARVRVALGSDTTPASRSVHDLAIAIAVLAAAGSVPSDRLGKTVLLGELALDGRLRRVRGILPAVLAAQKAGRTTVIVPESALPEASLATGIEVVGAPTLAAVVSWLRGQSTLSRPAAPPQQPLDSRDMREMFGPPEARWAVELAAAGGHHLLLTGAANRTLLASCLPAILPPLTDSGALEVAAIYSVAGILDDDLSQIATPPFVAPHYSSSINAMLGGGSLPLRPGAIPRAHRGVLFLDHAPEFHSQVLEALRMPLDTGQVKLARRTGVTRYPARFQLILGSDACPCTADRPVDCVCSPLQRRHYRNSLSCSLLDRIPIAVRVNSAATASRVSEISENSATVRARVIAAREAATARWREYGYRTNAEVPGELLRQELPLSHETRRVLDDALQRGQISMRGADNALRVAWTICDLRNDRAPTPHDVERAIDLRRLPWR